IDALAALPTDALLLVLAGEAVDPALDPALAAPLAEAIASGDFELKAGRTLYLHRPAGIKASRVVCAAAGGTSVQAYQPALAHGLGALKNLGAKQLVVALVGGEPVGAAHAEALVAAVSDATYVYRHTKPSAPPAGALRKVGLLADKSASRAVQQGLTRG